jgi:cytidylate kinase
MTADRPEFDADDDPHAGSDAPTPPLHGFQGDRGALPRRASEPTVLTIAISREAGSRGSSIGTRVGQKLSWQVYNQELLEYMAQESASRQDIAGSLTPTEARWAEDRLEELLREENLSQHPSLIDLARLVLGLGARGEVVLIGRGAGNMLPAASTLHVRIIAPLADRIAYMSQWLRLTEEAAAEQVRLRDQRRAEFISTHFHRQAGDCHQYDLLLNSGLLGEDLCADLIARAARAKMALFQGQTR